MPVIGLHASHEQLHPSVLLEAVRHAEAAGFDGAMCSDHFAPWNERQGESGFAWAWLGAALQATSLPIGVVSAPGQRYHPAIAAQAFSTLEAMFPGRFWVALGSGQNLNEHITGERWPAKAERDRRLRESADIIRRLLGGEEVSHDGAVTVDRARLWTRPASPPPLLAAAVTPVTAAWAAEWADGVATVNQPIENLREVVRAYRGNGGTGRLVLQAHVSYAASRERAEQIAHDQWRTNVFAPDVMWELDTPAAFDAAAEHVRPEDLHDSVVIASDPAEHADRLAQMIELGFDEVYLHQVGDDQRTFIDVFAEHVLPTLRDAASNADTHDTADPHETEMARKEPRA